MQVIINIPDALAEDLKRIASLTKETDFEKEYIEKLTRYVDGFKDKNKEFILKECLVTPSEYELTYAENEAKITRKKYDEKEYIAAHTKKCLLLDDKEKMLGHPYARIYDYSSENIIKVPLSSVRYING